MELTAQISTIRTVLGLLAGCNYLLLKCLPPDVVEVWVLELSHEGIFLLTRQ